jgi:hypothetical protein
MDTNKTTTVTSCICLLTKIMRSPASVVTSPSLQIANRMLYEGSCEHQRVTMRLNKNAVHSVDYLFSPLVKAWRHQQVRNTQAVRLRDTKGQA